MVPRPRIYRMFYRHPTAVLIFPFILVFWYMVVQTWPEGSFGEISTEDLRAVPAPAPTTSYAAPAAVLSETSHDKPIENYAYVFYATSNAYACSALVNIHRLRTIFHSKIPVIMLASSGVSNFTVSVVRENDIEVIREEPPPVAPGSSRYYSGVLLKLRALRLHQIKPKLKRIQIFDADQLIMKSPEPLFELPPVDVAAPLAYWLKGAAATTNLLVVSLSEGLWSIVNDAIHHISKDEYDMDLINRVLTKRLMILPGRYCTLNSHWEALDAPGWFGNTTETVHATDEELVDLYEKVEILHFTAVGKPWSVRLKDVTLLNPNAHPLLKEQFKLWKLTARDVCMFDYSR